MSTNSFVFMVDENTILTHLKYGFCAIGNPKKPISQIDFQNPLKDHLHYEIIADILNIKKGDWIFFYTKSKGFTGIHRVLQTVFFDASDIEGIQAGRPFRIFIQPLYYFEKAVPEPHLFLTPERQKTFWLWYFNKTRSSGRGCTPLDPDSRDKLVELLIKHNGEPISFKTEKEYPKRSRLQDISSLPVPYNETGSFTGRVLYENALKALMMLAFRDYSNVVSHIFGNYDNLEWYANEVPIDVGGSSIDIMLYHKTTLNGSSICARYQYTLIELKADKADLDILDQLQRYITWAGNTLAEGDHYLIQPVIVAYRFDEELINALKHLRVQHKPFLLIQYRYIPNNNNGLRLEKIPL
jgi:hypothetical protein